MSLFGGGRRGPRERTEEERRQALIERERRRTGNLNWEPPAGHPLSVSGQPAPSGPDPAASQPGPPAAPAGEASRPAQAQPSAHQPRPASRQAEQPAPPVARQQPAPAPEPAPLDDAWWDDIADDAPATPVAAWPPPMDPAPRATRPAAPAPQTRAFQSTPPSEDAAAPAFPEPPRLRPARPAESAQPAAAPRQIAPEPPAQPIAEAYDLPDYREVAVHRRRSIAGRAPRTVVSPPGDADMGGSLTPPRSRRRRVALLVVLLVLVGIGYSQLRLWEPGKGGGTGEVTVEIPEGASATDVANRLEQSGVIDSATIFGVRAMIAGKREDLVAGSYTLKNDMSYGAALTAITGGNVATPDLVSVVIPEGFSIRELASRFKRQNIVDDYGSTASRMLKERRAELTEDFGLPKGARTLDGLLFPATYDMEAGFTAEDLIDRQLTAMKQNFADVSLARAKKANLSRYDVLTIASMVEREAQLTRERDDIAAVIYNRLKTGMPLGIDATFRYESGNWTDPIRQSQLDEDTPYNSRTRTGLPPTPIGNPGLASIEAAAAPAKVDYLYFVVKPGRCGEHAFASTAEKFAEDSAKYNAARDAAGRSPVTC